MGLLSYRKACWRDGDSYKTNYEFNHVENNDEEDNALSFIGSTF